MADGSHIEWTDATWNPITGCSVVSPGCTNCYAMKLAGTRLQHHPSRAGLTTMTKAGPVWTGEVRLNEQWLDQPLRWRRPRRIFVCAHGDLFHEKVPDDWIDRVFAVMALCPQHTFQVLTKRADRMRRYMVDTPDQARFNRRARLVWGEAFKMPGRTFTPADLERQGCSADNQHPWPLKNAWLGVSVEDQVRAGERIPDLLATPAAVRFLSCEPLLGAIDLTTVCTGHHFINALTGLRYHDAPEGVAAASAHGSKLDWVICGGESGPRARPMHPDWARSLRDQCAAAGVPLFFKQWGEFGPDTGPLSNGRDPIFCGAGPCAAWTGEGWKFAPDGYRMPLDPYTARDWVYRLGKKRNGRLLDGVQHNGMPA